MPNNPLPAPTPPKPTATPAPSAPKPPAPTTPSAVPPTAPAASAQKPAQPLPPAPVTAKPPAAPPPSTLATAPQPPKPVPLVAEPNPSATPKPPAPPAQQPAAPATRPPNAFVPPSARPPVAPVGPTPPGMLPAGGPPGTPPGQPPKPSAAQGGAPTNPPAAQKPATAKPKSSLLRFLPFVLIGVVLLAVVGFIATRVLGLGGGRQSVSPNPSPAANGGRNVVSGQQKTITYWGLWEPSDVLTEVLADFEQANPGIKVQYQKQSHLDYRERLQSGIAAGTGPDLFRFHGSWTPMLRDELAPMPSSVYSNNEFQQTFYPAAFQQLQVGGQLVGVPLMYDGLALYYNKDVFNTANAQPPTTWAELRTLAVQLTVRGADNQIQRAGAALGNATNVEHFSDIIGLLMLQNGADPAVPTSPEASDAMTFYTNFMKVDRVWSDTLPSSTIAFARGDAAMMFAPSWRAHEVQTQNPNLNFGIAPLPKLGEVETAWASYWAEGVSAQSKNKDEAWLLIKYLSSPEVMKKLYSQQAEVRSFGEPYSRVDLANELAGEPLVAPYLRDAPSAQGWYLSSYTHDNGINDQLIKYYEDAVTAVLSGRQVEDVMKTVAQGTTQVLRQYGVSVGTTGTGTSR